MEIFLDESKRFYKDWFCGECYGQFLLHMHQFLDLIDADPCENVTALNKISGEYK